MTTTPPTSRAQTSCGRLAFSSTAEAMQRITRPSPTSRPRIPRVRRLARARRAGVTAIPRILRPAPSLAAVGRAVPAREGPRRARVGGPACSGSTNPAGVTGRSPGSTPRCSRSRSMIGDSGNSAASFIQRMNSTNAAPNSPGRNESSAMTTTPAPRKWPREQPRSGVARAPWLGGQANRRRRLSPVPWVVIGSCDGPVRCSSRHSPRTTMLAMTPTPSECDGGHEMVARQAASTSCLAVPARCGGEATEVLRGRKPLGEGPRRSAACGGPAARRDLLRRLARKRDDVLC
jgi:hypothetical protein